MKALRVAAVCGALAVSGSAVMAAEKPLRIVMVDVEGGQATLFVTPEGKSVLVDTGWPAGLGGPRGGPPPSQSSADRIVAAARKAGVSRIDYLIVSHYHLDHVGGVFDLAAKIPIGTFVDHGPNREEAPAGGADAGHPASLYPRYEALTKGRARRISRWWPRRRLRPAAAASRRRIASAARKTPDRQVSWPVSARRASSISQT
jgi:competence protein ComEC